MTISKLLPALCVLSAGSICFTVRADDNPSQAAARAALAGHIFEMGAPATNAPANNPAMAPVTTKQNREDAKAKAKADKAAAEQQAAQAKADAKAKQPSAPATQTASTTAPAGDNLTEAQRAAMSQIVSGNVATNNSNSAKSQPAAKAQKEKKDKKQKIAATGTNAVPGTVAADVNYVGKDLGMKPVAAPPAPVAASKIEKLQELLAKYRADQISPEEYQQQRKAIMAQP